MQDRIPITTELLNSVKESFKPIKRKHKQPRPCRIKFMGEFIRLNSGKELWNTVAHAKNALNNHLETSPQFLDVLFKNKVIVKRKNVLYHISFFDMKKLRQDLEEQGFIEYIELDADNGIG